MNLRKISALAWYRIAWAVIVLLGTLAVLLAEMDGSHIMMVLFLISFLALVVWMALLVDWSFRNYRQLRWVDYLLFGVTFVAFVTLVVYLLSLLPPI